MSSKPVACNECTNDKCEIRGDESRAKFPCSDFEKGDWNVFQLYAWGVTNEEIKKAKKAHAEIKAAVDRCGKELHRLCERWRSVGADDTASQDEIMHELGRKVRYGE